MSIEQLHPLQKDLAIQFLLHHMDMATRHKMMAELPQIYAAIYGKGVHSAVSEQVANHFTPAAGDDSLNVGPPANEPVDTPDITIVMEGGLFQEVIRKERLDHLTIEVRDYDVDADSEGAETDEDGKLFVRVEVAIGARA